MIGVNHRTAGVAEREALALGGERLGPTLGAFRERFPGAEAVLLCTCNRTELYAAPGGAPGGGDATSRGAIRGEDGGGSATGRDGHRGEGADATSRGDRWGEDAGGDAVDGGGDRGAGDRDRAVDAAALRGFLAERAGVGVGALDGAAELWGGGAVRHLMRVTAGLDAMAVGESQVLGQVRRAYEAADGAGTVGPVLHRVMQAALSGARRARRESGVDRLEHSVSSMAVALAGGVFESLAGKVVVGIGAGEITKVTLGRFLRQDPPPGRVWVVNRSRERAEGVAAALGIGDAAGGHALRRGHNGGAGGGGGGQEGSSSRARGEACHHGHPVSDQPLDATAGAGVGGGKTGSSTSTSTSTGTGTGAGVGGGVRGWGEMEEVLVEADVVVTGTAAAEPILTVDDFRCRGRGRGRGGGRGGVTGKGIAKRRRGRPLLVIDLAVPRDVEAGVGDLPGVYLYNIDDLRRALDESPERRERVARCEALVAEAAERCVAAGSWGGGAGDVGALVRGLRGKLRGIGERETRRTRRKLAGLLAAVPAGGPGSTPGGVPADQSENGVPGDEAAAIARLLDEHTHRLINKVLHLPLSRLDPATLGRDAGARRDAAALRRLFDLAGDQGDAGDSGDGEGRAGNDEADAERDDG